LAQEEGKEISFEEWLKIFYGNVKQLSEKTGFSVECLLMMIAIREAREIHQHFDWIYPQLQRLLKQDVRAQKRLLKELK